MVRVAQLSHQFPNDYYNAHPAGPYGIKGSMVSMKRTFVPLRRVRQYTADDLKNSVVDLAKLENDIQSTCPLLTWRIEQSLICTVDGGPKAEANKEGTCCGLKQAKARVLPGDIVGVDPTNLKYCDGKDRPQLELEVSHCPVILTPTINLVADQFEIAAVRGSGQGPRQRWMPVASCPDKTVLRPLAQYSVQEAVWHPRRRLC